MRCRTVGTVREYCRKHDAIDHQQHAEHRADVAAVRNDVFDFARGGFGRLRHEVIIRRLPLIEPFAFHSLQYHKFAHGPNYRGLAL
jgi:hypothetical protein